MLAILRSVWAFHGAFLWVPLENPRGQGSPSVQNQLDLRPSDVRALLALDEAVLVDEIYSFTRIKFERLENGIMWVVHFDGGKPPPALHTQHGPNRSLTHISLMQQLITATRDRRPRRRWRGGVA